MTWNKLKQDILIERAESAELSRLGDRRTKEAKEELKKLVILIEKNRESVDVQTLIKRLSIAIAIEAKDFIRPIYDRLRLESPLESKKFDERISVFFGQVNTTTKVRKRIFTQKTEKIIF